MLLVAFCYLIEKGHIDPSSVLRGVREGVPYNRWERDCRFCENSHASHTRTKSSKARLSTSSEDAAIEKSRQHA